MINWHCHPKWLTPLIKLSHPLRISVQASLNLLMRVWCIHTNPESKCAGNKQQVAFFRHVRWNRGNLGNVCFVQWKKINIKNKQNRWRLHKFPISNKFSTRQVMWVTETLCRIWNCVSTLDGRHWMEIGSILWERSHGDNIWSTDFSYWRRRRMVFNILTFQNEIRSSNIFSY